MKTRVNFKVGSRVVAYGNCLATREQYGLAEEMDSIRRNKKVMRVRKTFADQVRAGITGRSDWFWKSCDLRRAPVKKAKTSK
jgi:hypothetical protein